MKLIIAILFGKLVFRLTRFFSFGGGSAAPGVIALKIDPNFIEKIIKQLPQNIVITGTNGKTTTARILSHLLANQGLKIIRNSTGSNLERGIASTLISNSHLLSGKLNFDIGIWELDEAAFNSAVLKIRPEVIVFLNAFRDQLDRYGEVDTVVKKWCQTLKALSPQTKILVNGDDTNTFRLKECFRGKVYTFGVEGFKIKGESLEKSNHHHLDFEAKNVQLIGLVNSRFQIFINNQPQLITLPLPGIYHIYDAVAALVSTSLLNLPIPQYSNLLEGFQPAFGRVERFIFQPSRLQAKHEGLILLIKNPTGATQVFETLAPHLKKDDRLLLALNDNLADGTDVSWIWDAEFEKLQTKNYQLQIICSGARADDLAVRLKYAGFDPKRMIVDNGLEKALQSALRGLNGTLYILPTYTAMLKLQRILTKAGIKRHYWEEG